MGNYGECVHAGRTSCPLLVFIIFPMTGIRLWWTSGPIRNLHGGHSTACGRLSLQVHSSFGVSFSLVLLALVPLFLAVAFLLSVSRRARAPAHSRRLARRRFYLQASYSILVHPLPFLTVQLVESAEVHASLAFLTVRVVE